MMTVTETSQDGRNDDEATLVAEVRSGNATCFETLMRRYERKIYRLAKNITKNDSDAEEVTQEAFFKAFEQFRRFQRRVALLYMACANHRQSSTDERAKAPTKPVLAR